MPKEHELPMDETGPTETGEGEVPTAESAEDIGKNLSKTESARLRRLADAMFWRAFTQGKEKGQ